jgi:S-adenosylmethionine hydrolase
MPVITLLTDFGLNNEYVGAMKGVILSVNPLATVVDIHHQIDPYDTISAAYQVKAYYSFFPSGTIHIIVVDPGVGGNRRILAVQVNDHIFLSPDNGVLSLVLDGADIKKIHHVENTNYFLKPVSHTFHGRDIFAPVAAHLSLGKELGKIGRPVDIHQICLLDFEKAFFSDEGQLVGRVVSVDRFGNLITNIENHTIDQMLGSVSHERMEVRIHHQRIKGLSSSFDQAAPKAPLAIIGSRGYLEIAINCGSAQNFFGVANGDRVYVSLSVK